MCIGWSLCTNQQEMHGTGVKIIVFWSQYYDWAEKCNSCNQQYRHNSESKRTPLDAMTVGSSCILERSRTVNAKCQVLHCATIALCHYWIVPLLHCATIALCHLNCATIELCHYCIMPLLHCATIALCRYWIVPLLHYATIALCHYCIVPLLHCATIACSDRFGKKKYYLWC